MLYLFLKRAFDLLVSLAAIIVLSPLLIPIIILLRVTAEGEVFYLQTRIGYKNQKFKIWKFATMLKNSPNMGTGSLTVRNDPRVTTMGKYLRFTKINELPQLINVLKGDMSLVGPRPQMEVDFFKFPEDIQNMIYNRVPGITGIGSIVFRDEEKLLSNTELSPQDFYKIHIAPYKGKLEIWYQENASFYTDFMILFLTVWVILFPKSNLLFQVFNSLPPVPEALNNNI